MVDDNMDDDIVVQAPIISHGVRVFKIVESDAEMTFYVADALLQRHIRQPLLIYLDEPRGNPSIDTFGIFVKWLDACDETGQFITQHEIGDLCGNSVMRLFKLFLFATKNGIEDLECGTFRRLSSMVGGITIGANGGRKTIFTNPGSNDPLAKAMIGVDEVGYAYSDRMHGYELRRFVVVAFFAGSKVPTCRLGGYPKEFLLDVLTYITEHESNTMAQRSAQITLNEWREWVPDDLYV